MKRIVFIIYIFIQILGICLANESYPDLPDTPKITPKEEVEEGWVLERNYIAVVDEKVKVFVPLEIISDINIDAVVVDNEEVKIPFEIKLNKEPEKKDYYKLKFSETNIDIDNDGKVDTIIYAPKYINKRIVDESYVKIKGENISKDGDYQKKIYVTIEVEE